MNHHVRLREYRARRGAVLLCAMVVTAIAASVVVLMVENASQRRHRTRRAEDNAQVELAALSLASAPSAVRTLSLPEGRRVETTAGDIVLTDKNGRVVAALAISGRPRP